MKALRRFGVPAGCVIAIAGAWVLLLEGVDPVPTWFYVFAWYPTLVLADWYAHRRGTPLTLSNPRLVASLLGWSAIIWLIFEAANFRLLNWYYVFLPRTLTERWLGILVSFATVVPAVVLAERCLRVVGLGGRATGTRVIVRPGDLVRSQLLGALAIGLSLTWPRIFFPLIWGGLWLLVEPVVYRRRPAWSLYGDLERGEWGRLTRLLTGGLVIGLLWEFYNYWARGKWIYTVPWLEQLKLFEMPPLGFLGFPFFALEAWAMYHALCAIGVAVPLEGKPVAAPASRRLIATAAVAFATTTLLLMDQRTVSSTVPRVGDLPGVSGERRAAFERAGVRSIFSLAADSTERLAQVTGLAPQAADSVIHSARLILLRGIGARHGEALAARGVTTVCDLSVQDPRTLWIDLHRGTGGARPTPAEVRGWVASARRHCVDRT